MDRGRLATARAILEGRWPLVVRHQRLAFQGQGEHLLRKDLLNLDEEVFQVSQLGSPGRPLGPPETVGQVFGHAFDIRTDFIHLGGALLGACHP